MMTPMVTTPKGILTRRQRARRVMRRVWQKMSLPVFFVLFLFGFLYYTTSTIVLYGR